MQVMATPTLDRQKRSLSYNDLKRKRLMRSARSHKKLHPLEEQPTAKKNMSDYKAVQTALPQNEQALQGCLQELKGALGGIRSRSSKKRIISIKESLTERPSLKPSADLRGTMWGNAEEAGDTKQLIKQLLNKNKSQRRLTKFNDIRDKFKKEKERSLSNEKQLQIKIIPSLMKDIKERTVVNLQISQEDKQIHNKSTQPLPRPKQIPLQQQLQRLQKCSSLQMNSLWAQEITGKENEQMNVPNIPDISCIKGAHADHFNESQLKLLQTAESHPSETPQGSFLQLLKDNVGSGKWARGKQVRRRGELQRVKRIFPSGFFDN